MVNKQEAIRLREQGMSYPKIAAQLGCSEIWCKKELSWVTKGNAGAAAYVDYKIKAIKILEGALQQLREM